MTTPRFSVIIPVFNDHEGLARCLEGLSAQTLPADVFEICIVDNGSAVSPRSRVTLPENASVFDQPKPGSYAARNLGVQRSRGELLAFLDADAVPAPGWLSVARDFFLHSPDCMVAAGDIDLVFEREGDPSLWEQIDSMTALTQERYVRDAGFGVTANLFVRRRAFENVGPFAEWLLSGGDREWGERAARHGYLTLFLREARVAHAARRTFAEIFKKQRRVAGGLVQLHLSRHPDRSRLATLLARSPLPPVRRVVSVLTSAKYGTLPRRLALASSLVFFKYVVYLEYIRVGLGFNPKRA